MLPGRNKVSEWVASPNTNQSCVDLKTGRVQIIWTMGLACIIALGLALRAVVRWHSGEVDFWTNGYTFFFDMARNIAAGDGITLDRIATAFRVPLYPVVLAALTFGHKEFFPILLAQSLIGAATVWCAALIARELFGEAAAIIAAFMTAFYPYYVVHDTALQETSLYTLLTALAVLLLMRVRRNGSAAISLCAGVALGAAVLTRATLAPFAALAPLWLVVRSEASAGPWKRRLRTCLICLGATAMTIAPWLAHSYKLTGSPTISTEGGFFLWLGNNPYTFSRYPNESIDRSEDVALEALSPADQAQIKALAAKEVAVDQWFLSKGLDYMSQNPWQTIAGGVRKIGAAFCLLPSPRRTFWPSLLYLLSYGPVMTLGLWGMWTGRQKWREHLIFYLLFVTFLAETAIFFGHTSYRAYLDVYLIVFAAGTVVRLMSNALPTVKYYGSTKHGL
jgi:4-amino-4-deoxy-L-arabinose transferase-like glycosyltransferase